MGGGENTAVQVIQGRSGGARHRLEWHRADGRRVSETGRVQRGGSLGQAEGIVCAEVGRGGEFWRIAMSAELPGRAPLGGWRGALGRGKAERPS